MRSVTFWCATDLVSDAVEPSYSTPSGSLFPLGESTLNVLAVDDWGNEAACSFVVTVADTVAPLLDCPEDVRAEATSVAGAVVEYAPAKAVDAVGVSEVIHSQAAGSLFPLGVTTVVASARDLAGHVATCSFTVEVVDTTGPAIECPSDLSIEAEAEEGVEVTWADATADDEVTAAPPIVYSHARGSVFAPGSTEVVAEAVDAAGNRSSCSFVVEVQYVPDEVVKPKKQKGGGGCAVGGSGAAPLALLIAGAAILRLRRR